MSIYIICSIVFIFVSFLPFHNYIEINYFSLAPVILCLVSILQGCIFKSYSNADEDELRRSNTAYSTIDIDYAAYSNAMRYHGLTKLAIIPLLVLLIFYFYGWLKLLLSLFLYFISYIVSFILVRLKK